MICGRTSADQTTAECSKGGAGPTPPGVLRDSLTSSLYKLRELYSNTRIAFESMNVLCAGETTAGDDEMLMDELILGFPRPKKALFVKGTYTPCNPPQIRIFEKFVLRE